MELSWLQSILMGLASGFSEPLPLSAEAHRALLTKMFGVGQVPPLFSLGCHMAVLVVVLMTGHLEISRLRRTHKLLKTPARRRTGHPDLLSAGTIKLLRSAGLVAIVGRLLSVHLGGISEKLYLLAAALLLSGLLQWMPNHFRTANKDARHLSPSDGALMGLGAALCAVPGISAVGSALSIGSMLGVDRRYALRFSWLLLCLSLGAAVVIDCLGVLGAGSFALAELLSAAIGAAAAALGAYAAAKLMRSLVRRGGLGITGFCYYNWGMALLCLVLFLCV